MNKHFLFTMLAASTMVLATGCSSSDDTAVTPENNSLAAVSFSVQADAVAGTRAISDGSGADELIYRVFDKDGNSVGTLDKKTETGLTDLLTGHSTWPRARPTRWPSGHRMPTARHIPSMTTWA